MADPVALVSVEEGKDWFASATASSLRMSDVNAAIGNTRWTVFVDSSSL
jgi:hypothetical protein